LVIIEVFLDGCPDNTALIIEQYKRYRVPNAGKDLKSQNGDDICHTWFEDLPELVLLRKRAKYHVSSLLYVFQLELFDCEPTILRFQ
jgi:hypothetical protein